MSSRNCKQCGKRFPAKGKQIFCCAACRNRYHSSLYRYRQRQRLWRRDYYVPENTNYTNEITHIQDQGAYLGLAPIFRLLGKKWRRDLFLFQASAMTKTALPEYREYPSYAKITGTYTQQEIAEMVGMTQQGISKRYDNVVNRIRNLRTSGELHRKLTPEELDFIRINYGELGKSIFHGGAAEKSEVRWKLDIREYGIQGIIEHYFLTQIAIIEGITEDEEEAASLAAQLVEERHAAFKPPVWAEQDTFDGAKARETCDRAVQKAEYIVALWNARPADATPQEKRNHFQKVVSLILKNADDARIVEYIASWGKAILEGDEQT